MTRTVILGTGSCLPARVLTNADLERIVDTSDEWITTRTGIKSRRIAGSGEETSKLAAAAARRALEMSALAADEIDLIIVGTMTPDMTMPSCACLVQKEIGAERAAAFDLNAACSGFLFGLDLADKYIKSDPGLKILVIGAETLSARVNWRDRNTCVLFGDGAGACVVTGHNRSKGILSSRLFSDGRLWNLLNMNGAPSMNPDLMMPPAPDSGEKDNPGGSYIRMSGPDVFKHAVRAMENAAHEVSASAGCAVEQIDLFIPHQANIRIFKTLSERLGVPFSKFYINIDRFGNTSAASVPIALDEANREGRLKEGDLILLCVFGGGFTWGGAVIKW